MKAIRILEVVAALFVVAGCGTIADARRAQKAQEDRAAGCALDERNLRNFSGSLEEMVGFALANRPSMAKAWMGVAEARLAMKTIAADAPLASSTPWNAFGVDGSLGHSESSKSAHFKDFETKTDGKGSATLSIDVLLWDFGRNRANIRAQAERVIAAELEAEGTGYTVFNEVASAYFERLQSAALLEVAFTNEQMRIEHLALAEERLAAGEAQKLDVLRARLDLAEARESVVAASNNLQNASAQLANAIGVDADYGVSIPLGDAALMNAVMIFATTEATSRELFDFARTNAPTLRVSRARLRAASAEVDHAVADLMPTLSASVSLNWTDPLWYWRWGVNVAQSLFSGFRRTTAVERAVVAMDLAAAEVDDAELSLSLALELAVNERDNAREAFATAEASVRSARENLDTVTEQFSVGDASRVEFTDAVADYASALANRVKAFYRGQIAEAKLFALVGVKPTFLD